MFYNVRDRASVIIIIDWDVVWLPDEIAGDDSTVFLAIKIDKVSEVSTSGYLETDLPHFAICETEIESVGDRQLLIISSCMGGDVEITFLGKMTFLALDSNQSLLKI